MRESIILLLGVAVIIGAIVYGMHCWSVAVSEGILDKIIVPQCPAMKCKCGCKSCKCGG